MGIYQIGNRWYVDLYIDGRRKRKAIGSRKEAENALTAVVAEWGEIAEAGDDAKYEEISNNRIAQRIKALENVDDRDLAELRDRCISILKEGLMKWPCKPAG